MTLLSEAEDIIDGKSEDHGPPEDSFARIASYWQTYIEIEYGEPVEFDEADVAEMMALFKLARAQSGRYNEDDYRDRAGYIHWANELRQ